VIAGIRAVERGSASVELMGILPLLLLAGLTAWQILLAAMTVTSAENAARAASRAEGRDDRGAEVGRDALPLWLRDQAEVQLSGTKATVVIEVPIIVPGLSTGALTVSRSAELPEG
jgi:hypothetical protein